MRFIPNDEKAKIVRSGRTVQSYTIANYEGNPKAKYVVMVVSYEGLLYWVELLKVEGQESKICEVFLL